MQFAVNIFASWKSLVAFTALALALSACSTWEIPDVPIYKEIPFVDGAEGVFVNTMSQRQGAIGVEEWAKLAPFLLCIDPEGFEKIKVGWLKACRMLKQDCTTEVETIMTGIRKLDELTRKVMNP